MGKLARDMEDKAAVRKNIIVQRTVCHKYATAPTPNGNLVYAERNGGIVAWRKDFRHLEYGCDLQQPMASVPVMDQMPDTGNTVRKRCEGR